MWINTTTCKISYPQVTIGRLALTSNGLATTKYIGNTNEILPTDIFVSKFKVSMDFTDEG